MSKKSKAANLARKHALRAEAELSKQFSSVDLEQVKKYEDRLRELDLLEREAETAAKVKRIQGETEINSAKLAKEKEEIEKHNEDFESKKADEKEQKKRQQYREDKIFEEDIKDRKANRWIKYINVVKEFIVETSEKIGITGAVKRISSGIESVGTGVGSFFNNIGKWFSK